MDVDYAKLGEYFAASARLVACKKTLESRIVSANKDKEDLHWAGELLECIDLDCGNYETAQKYSQLSEVSSLLRPKFYQTLIVLSQEGNFPSDKLEEGKNKLERIYAALKSSQLSVLDEDEIRIAGRLFDEFQEDLLRASRSPENV